MSVRATAIPAVVVVTLALCAAAAAREESLPQLIARAEAAHLQDRPPLYAEIAERQLRSAGQLYDDGKVDQAQNALKDVVSYSDKASDAASQSGKKLKNTEIALRKMAEQLRNMKRGLEFEDQAPVQDAIEHLENLRTNLLNRMFGKGPK